MKTFNSETGVMSIRKKDVIGLSADMPREALGSFHRYLREQVYLDIRYLAEKLTEVFKMSVVFSNVRVEKPAAGLPLDMKREPNKIIKIITDITTTFANDETVTATDVVLFQLPFMEPDGVFSNGSAIVSRLAAAEEMTYDSKAEQLTVALPTRKINFKITARDIVMYGSDTKKVSLFHLLIAMITEKMPGCDYHRFFAALFHNGLARSNINDSMDLLALTAADTADKFAGSSISFGDYLKTEWMSLGATRRAINRHFSLSKAVGQSLGEDLRLPLESVVIPKGTVIDAILVKRLERNRVQKIYVKCLPYIAGLVLAKDYPINIIPKGARVTPEVLSIVPDLKGYKYVPDDIAVNVTFYAGGKIKSMAQIELIFECGYDGILTTRGPYEYKGAHEILTNMTTSVSALFDSVPQSVYDAGYFHDDYVSNDALKKWGIDGLSDKALFNEFMPDHFTVWDFAALYSFASGIISLKDVHWAYNRDLDFCKRVDGPCELFSEAFRHAVRSITTAGSRSSIKDVLRKGNSEKISERFKAITLKMERYLREASLVRTVEYINPLAAFTLPRRIVTVAKNATVEQRDIAMGQYGKICPYETPSGEKIGLFNTIAINAKVSNGRLTTPYHPIVKRNGVYYVSREIVYLNSLEEIGKRIGDILSIVNTDNERTFDSPIRPTPVLARVPAIHSSGERITVDTVMSTTLDYVNVSPEQSLSNTVTLIPFAGADDGARVSFAASMFKQAVHIMGAEVPLVLTSGYSGVFPDNSRSYLVKAPQDGVIESITPTSIMLEGGKSISIKETQVRQDTFVALDYKKNIGDRIRKGDILADTIISRDGYFTPGANCIVAYLPYYGYSHEDAIVISSMAAEKFTSISVNKIECEKFNDLRTQYTLVHQDSKIYLDEGDTAFSIDAYDRTLQRSRSKPKEIKVTHHKGGLLYHVGKKVKEGTVAFRATTVDFQRLNVGDKMTGRHGNKGVVSKIVLNSEMPSFLNGRLVDVLLNPCGVPARMNIGQVFEAHLGFVAYLLGIKIESNAFNGATKDDIMELLDFVWQLANEENSDMVLTRFSQAFPPELIRIARERIPFIREWGGCFNKDGSAILINQVTGKPFELPITFGVSYILKLSHQVAHKMHVRDTNGKYSRIEKQPVRGQAGNGGQRVGEMELAVLSAHGATAIIREMLNEKSDNVTLREKLANLPIGEQITMVDMEGTSTRSVELMRYYLEGIGLETDVAGGSDISLASVSKRQRPGRRSSIPGAKADDYSELIDQGLSELQSFAEIDTPPVPAISADPLVSDRPAISSDPLVRDTQ